MAGNVRFRRLADIGPDAKQNLPRSEAGGEGDHRTQIRWWRGQHGASNCPVDVLSEAASAAIELARDAALAAAPPYPARAPLPQATSDRTLCRGFLLSGR